MTIDQQSVLITDVKEPLIIKQTDIPNIGPYEVLIENSVIGLNPIDWKSKKYNFAIHSFPWINGRESSGEIAILGASVKGLKVGDKVIHVSTSYRDLRTSTFQKYSVADHRLIWKLPEEFTHIQGATLGVGLTTAAMIFYNSFGIDVLANFHQKAIVIWGASTVVGLYLAQLARIHNLRVIGVSTPIYSDYLKNNGVDVVLDRHLGPQEIKLLLKDEDLIYGVDCISEETSKIVLDILLDRPKAAFLGIVKVPKVESSTNVHPVKIKEFHENIEVGSRIIAITSNYLESGQIKPVNSKVYNGLHKIEEALLDLESIGAKAEKYVVTV